MARQTILTHFVRSLRRSSVVVDFRKNGHTHPFREAYNPRLTYILEMVGLL